MGNRIQNSQQPNRPKDVSVILHESRDQIARALPKHLTPDRMLRIVLTEVRKNPKLGLCDPYSFIGAVIQCSQLGLEPGSGLGHAYLIPYGKEVTFIPGYKGLIDLARRSGQIKAIDVDVVYKGDAFRQGIKDGRRRLDWEPLGERGDDKNVTHVFACAEFANGSHQWAVMTIAEVNKIRDGLRYVSDVWKNHYVEMAKKTAVRRLCKMLPQSAELVQAQEIDDVVNDGGRANSHAPLIEAGIIDASYNVDPGHNPGLAIAESEAAAKIAGHESPSDKIKMDAARKTAIDEFMMTVEQVGAPYAETLLGEKPSVVVLRSTDQINAAVDVIEKALNTKGTK